MGSSRWWERLASSMVTAPAITSASALYRTIDAAMERRTPCGSRRSQALSRGVGVRRPISQKPPARVA